MHPVIKQEQFMMESTKQRLLVIKFIISLVILILFTCCKQKSSNGKLECILGSINLENKGMIMGIGQHNGWTDSTVIILITYHKKSDKKLIKSNLKGVYNRSHIYFYQNNIDTLDKKTYKQISNKIDWQNYIPQEVDKDYIAPPYDPINIQIEYDLEKECIIEVIRGKGYINTEIISKCRCQY